MLDEDKGIGSQPENRSRQLSKVDPESVAPAATRLDQLRTIASPYPPEKYAVCRVTDHKQ